MNVSRSRTVATVLAATTLAVFTVSHTGCSSEDSPEGPPPNDNTPDAMVMDAEPVADAGLLDTCPVPGNFPNGMPLCLEQLNCGDNEMIDNTSCEFCRAYSNWVCKLGQCEMPARLEPDEGIELRFLVVDVPQVLESFAGIVVAAETTGGETISCEDVYGPNWDLTEGCYNWLDSSFANALGDPAQGYPIRFSRFPAGRRVLAIVYGFEQDRAAGQPAGISCTEIDVPEANSRDEDLQVEGDRMRSIQ